MQSSSESESNGVSSRRLNGIIAIAGGAAMALAYWRQPIIGRQLSAFGRLVYVCVACGLCAWGSGMVVYSLLRPAQRRGGRSFLRRAFGGTSRGPSISWLGLLLILAGIELLSAQAWRLRSGPYQLVAIAAGLAFVLWGVAEMLPHLWPRTHRSSGPRNRVALPRPGLAYLVIMAVMFVGSLLGRSNMLLLVFALLAGPFVLNGWITFSLLKRIRLERRVPSRVMAGETATVELVLRNQKRWLSGWLLSVRDPVENDEEQLAPEVLFSRVPPRSQRSALYHVRLMQRGPYQIGPAVVTTRFPLGLVERGLVFDRTDSILVYPRLGRLTSAWRRQFGIADELVHRQETRRGVFDDEFHGIREFRWGDNPRAIHWRTSARLNATMVREFHQSRDRDLLVLVDLWLPRRADDAERERVELAVSFAATVCVEHMRVSRDANLYLSAAGEELREWQGLSSPANVEPLLDLLAIVRGGERPSLSEQLVRAAERRTSNSSVLLVSTRPDLDRRLHEWPEVTGTREVQEMGSSIQVLHASPEALLPLFLLEWDAPSEERGAAMPQARHPDPLETSAQRAS